MRIKKGCVSVLTQPPALQRSAQVYMMQIAILSFLKKSILVRNILIGNILRRLFFLYFSIPNGL
ncbi:hypothetical protein BACOVA_05514 [Bacteroides ovatus ATCC 8483]|uniref:Uncharacterized protein n=1 Tax=Bacteroides ovatus (strain ATCC 8483 / DSM 1896 / JCM 5824 / BCRC 10623 / CCUG 4943 / NCTC 11153) TaxID=411476 RepID=A0AAN3D5D6_BACO1|nr:hypothetical protein BACOVA_05514 [Bacteroides ovatus ATCC 8483]